MYQMFNWRLIRVSDCRNYNEGQLKNIITQNLIFKMIFFLLLLM